MQKQTQITGVCLSESGWEVGGTGITFRGQFGRVWAQTANRGFYLSMICECVCFTGIYFRQDILTGDCRKYTNSDYLSLLVS